MCLTNSQPAEGKQLAYKLMEKLPNGSYRPIFDSSRTHDARKFRLCGTYKARASDEPFHAFTTEKDAREYEGVLRWGISDQYLGPVDNVYYIWSTNASRYTPWALLLVNLFQCRVGTCFNETPGISGQRMTIRKELAVLHTPEPSSTLSP